MANSLERAAAVAKFVELRSVSLRAANLATSLSPLELPSSLAIQSRYRSRHEAAGEQHFVVSIDLEFEGRATDTVETESAPALRLDATFTLVYEWKPNADYPEGATDDFARLNGAYNVWPYWRELVQTVSGRVGLAGMIVPVFRADDFEMRFKAMTDRTGGPTPTQAAPATT
jgi:hypothetical protein